MPKPMYDVAPRYTCGSPGLVDEETARRVAREELSAYERCLEGTYGDELQAKAKLMGLRGVAEVKLERGSGKTHRWEVEDLCTGEKYDLPMSEVLRKQGFKAYRELEAYEKELVEKNPPKGVGDFRRNGYFKVLFFDRVEAFTPVLKHS